ncbi:hypothetical protein [Nocardia sp. NPDC004711]
MSTDPDFGPDLATGEAQPKPRPRAVGLPPMAAMLSRRMASEPAVPAETGQATDEADEDQAAAADFDETDADEFDYADDADDGEDDETGGDYEDFDDDDGQDYDGEDAHGTDPQFNPDRPSAGGAVVRVGSWDSWLPVPAKSGRVAPARAAADDVDEFDEFDDEADEFDLPDYDAMNQGRESYGDTARAAFSDRSGGRVSAARARLKRRRRNTDGGHEVYRARSAVPAVLAVAGVVAVVTVVIVVNVRGGSSPLLAPAGPAHPSGSASPAQAAVSTPAQTETYPHATSDCYATRTADTVVGAGPGDPNGGGPGAILGFEWSYYADRSGARARDWVASESSVPDAATIQAGIDTVPVATKYCVHISKADADGSGNTWSVVLSEQYPTDKTPQQWHQTITTASVGGRVLITAIRKAD